MSDDTLLPRDDVLTKYKKTSLYQAPEHKGKDEHLENRVFYREGPEELTKEESLMDSPYYEDLRYIYLYPVVILENYLIDLNTVKRIATEYITELFRKYPNIPRKDIIGTVMTELKKTREKYPPVAGSKVLYLPSEHRARFLIGHAVGGAKYYLNLYENWTLSEITEERDEIKRVKKFIQGEEPDDKKGGGQRAGKRNKKSKKRKCSKRKKKSKKRKPSKRKKKY